VESPDIMDFIDCKAKEEAKAFTLIKAGYDGFGPGFRGLFVYFLPECEPIRSG